MPLRLFFSDPLPSAMMQCTHKARARRRGFEAVLLKMFVILLALLSYAQTSTADPPLLAAAAAKPGTTITNQNWQQYRQFMSQGLMALFEGKYFWRMPSDLRIEVGPTTQIPLPQKYLDDTRKYSSQVRLLRTSTGSYVPTGYVAGIPFPHPLEGEPSLAGQRIFWNSYYRYQPRVQGAPTYTYTLDSFGNMTQTSEVKTVLSQLAFLSDIDFPRTVPYAGDYYFRQVQ